MLWTGVEPMVMTVRPQNGVWYVDDNSGGSVPLETVLWNQEELINNARDPADRARRRGYMQLQVIHGALPNALYRDSLSATASHGQIDARDLYRSGNA